MKRTTKRNTETTRHGAEFADRLRALTKEFGSRYALAKASGIPASTLQGYEAGAKPGMDALLTLARIGNVDIRWLMTGEGEMRPRGLLSGALLADIVMVYQYELGSSLKIPEPINQIPFSRHILETRLGLKQPTSKSLLVVEAAGDLYRISRRDLVLIDRSQASLVRDGMYLLDLPGLALRAISRGVGDKVQVIGPEHEPNWSSEQPDSGTRKGLTGIWEVRLSELLAKVVGRAVWVGRAI
jgi:transcriptional regulator with XRE-family HTH domain